MATEQTATGVSTDHESFPEWTGWLAALFGLWTIASPFALSGSFGDGAPFYGTVGAGVVLVVLGAYTAWSIRSTDVPSPAEWAAWIVGLVGAWTAVSPFVLTGSIGSGPPFYSTVAAGFVAVVLAAYAAYAIRTN